MTDRSAIIKHTPADLTPLLTGVTRNADGCDTMPPGVTTRRAVTDDAAETIFGVAPKPPATNVPATLPPTPAGTVATPCKQQQTHLMARLPGNPQEISPSLLSASANHSLLNINDLSYQVSGSDVTIAVFSSIRFFTKEFDLDFFVPIFGVEDINSSALGIIGFVKI